MRKFEQSLKLINAKPSINGAVLNQWRWWWKHKQAVLSFHPKQFTQNLNNWIIPGELSWSLNSAEAISVRLVYLNSRVKIAIMKIYEVA